MVVDGREEERVEGESEEEGRKEPNTTQSSIMTIIDIAAPSSRHDGALKVKEPR